MSVAHGRICGVPMLLFRVSFTGELGFEINVPADFGLNVWEAVHAAGQAHGMTEYGTETMHVLRAEKGYIIVGQDTDGTVTPDDAGLTWAVGKNKADFVGKRSLERASMKSANRKQLVGLRTKDRRLVLEEGAQVAAKAGQAPPMELIGHVTSSYASSVLGYSIALALVAGGRARLGQPCTCPCLPVISRSKSPRRFFTIPAECASMVEAAARSSPQVPDDRMDASTPSLHAFHSAWRCAGAGGGGADLGSGLRRTRLPRHAARRPRHAVAGS